MPRYFSKQQLSHKSKSELERIVANNAKTANQRLRELEKQGLTKDSAAYRYIEKESKNKAKYLSTTGGKVRGKQVGQAGKIKFRTDTKKMSKEELQREASELHDFLYVSKTSTVKGVKAAHQKAYETATKSSENVPEYVTDFFKSLTPQEFNELWENGGNKHDFYRTLASLYEYSTDNDLNLSTADLYKLMDIVENAEKLSLSTLQLAAEKYAKLKEEMLPSDEEEITFKDIFGIGINDMPFPT